MYVYTFSYFSRKKNYFPSFFTVVQANGVLMNICCLLHIDSSLKMYCIEKMTMLGKRGKKKGCYYITFLRMLYYFMYFCLF